MGADPGSAQRLPGRPLVGVGRGVQLVPNPANAEFHQQVGNSCLLGVNAGIPGEVVGGDPVPPEEVTGTDCRTGRNQ